MQYLRPNPGTNVLLDGYFGPVSVSNFVGSFGGDVTIGGNNDGATFFINGNSIDANFSGGTVTETGFGNSFDLRGFSNTYVETDGGGDDIDLGSGDDFVFFDGSAQGGVTTLKTGGGVDQLTVEEAFGHAIILEDVPEFMLDNTYGGDFNREVSLDDFYFDGDLADGLGYFDGGYAYSLHGGGSLFMSIETYQDAMLG